ncbi:hypothetical protein PhCBS80983_g00691 [Powellomyces hirtus]|uniref:SGNH hydrolase-type esterase domain-containing protein n=1 Tax=Powellomyces hirtus TaxID=109895 RepID=A0A507EEB9_9FUNG|nr:hypothetical protein PhCBS80983_g00691 [Powellomyces hirtus]
MKIATLLLALIPASLATRTLHLAGDSTGADGGSAGTVGWGKYLQDFFNPNEIKVNNGARGGRSTRTFLSDGSWAAIMKATKPNDIVMIQFGHNDASPITDAKRSRGVLRGVDESFQDTVNGLTGKKERVYTFGHYLRTMIRETRAKGAIPVLVSKTLNKKWNTVTNRVDRGDRWSEWSFEVAKAEKTAFLDMRNLAADSWERHGIQVLNKFFPTDGTHTSPKGARYNAISVARAFWCTEMPQVTRALSKTGCRLAKPTQCYNSKPAVQKPEY